MQILLEISKEMEFLLKFCQNNMIQLYTFYYFLLLKIMLFQMELNLKINFYMNLFFFFNIKIYTSQNNSLPNKKLLFFIK